MEGKPNVLEILQVLESTLTEDNTFPGLSGFTTICEVFKAIFL